ncbi:MAG: YqaJ viral recombinase family protein [Solimonas sp.]
MREIDVQPNTREWEAHRAKTRNASEAPVVMGASSKTPRGELVHLKATGGEKEFSQWVKEVLFARGHAVEPALRAYAERIIGEDLYQVVAVSDDGDLGASYDGLTLDERVIFEGKQFNQKKIAHVRAYSSVPQEDYWQVIQQFGVCEKAELCIYVVGDGTEENTVYVKVDRDADVEADILTLRAAWAQFDADVAAYTPPPAEVVVVATPVAALPAVSVQVDGQLTVRDNFPVFKAAIEDFLEHRLIREPKTDQDFADLDLQIKAMKNAEAALDAAEGQMLAQVSAIDSATKTKAMLSKLVRDNRLMAEKLLTGEKERRRGEILTAARDALGEHIQQINKTLGSKIRMPDIAADFATAMRSKKTLSSLKEAADGELARAKIEANQVADRIRVNLEVLRTDAVGYETLFMDAQALATSKAEEDLRNLVKSRIADHKAKEDARLEAERQRIRVEEEARAQREAEAAKQRQLDAERARIREEERALAAAVMADSLKSDSTAVSAGVPAATTQAPAPSAAIKQGGGAAPAPAMTLRGVLGDALRAGAGASVGQARIKLGDINTRIAPLRIDAQGLAELGFQSVGTEGAAKLYDASQFPAMCSAMVQRLTDAAAPLRAAA